MPDAQKHIDAIRETFEAWVRTETTLPLDRNALGYVNVTTTLMWDAWRAALRAEKAQPTRWMHLPPTPPEALTEQPAQVMRDLPVQPAVELRRIREHLNCENGGDPIAAINMLMSWEADANRRADILADHLRWVIEIARTWQPDYATDRDLADIAGAEDALNGKTKTAQPADVARLVEAIGRRFRSGNGVPVERAVVPAAEWAALREAIGVKGADHA